MSRIGESKKGKLRSLRIIKQNLLELLKIQSGSLCSKQARSIRLGFIHNF